MKKTLCVLVVALFVLGGCSTSFYGSSRVKNGPAGCEKKCSEWGLEFAGMVALGEYSDGCICKKKGEKLSMQDVGETILLSAAGLGGGVAGIWTQMEEEND